MYDNIYSFHHHNDTDVVDQILSLAQLPLLLVSLRDGFGLHQWDVTVEQLLRFLKVHLVQHCLPHTLMKTDKRSFISHVRTNHSFDKNLAPSAISANIRTYARTTETLLFRSMSYLVQHIILHRGFLCRNISMLAPREDLEADCTRTLHQQIRHNLTRCCGQCYYEHLHRGVTCKDDMGTTNAIKKEDFHYCGICHGATVSLLSIPFLFKASNE